MEAKTRGRRRRWRYIMLSVLALPVLAITGAFALTRMEPAHWREHRTFLDRTTPSQRVELADRARAKIATALTDEPRQTAATAPAPRTGASAQAFLADRIASQTPTTEPAPESPEAARQVVITQDELNALVEDELSNWAAAAGHEMPREIINPMVGAAQGRYVIAFEYRSARYSQVLSAYFDLDFLDNGRAVVRMDEFDAGRLPVPADQMGQYLGEKFGDERARKIGDWLAKLKRYEFEPVLKLNNGRRLRIENVRTTGAGYELTVRTDGRPAPQTAAAR